MADKRMTRKGEEALALAQQKRRELKRRNRRVAKTTVPSIPNTRVECAKPGRTIESDGARWSGRSFITSDEIDENLVEDDNDASEDKTAEDGDEFHTGLGEAVEISIFSLIKENHRSKTRRRTLDGFDIVESVRQVIVLDGECEADMVASFNALDDEDEEWVEIARETADVTPRQTYSSVVRGQGG